MPSSQAPETYIPPEIVAHILELAPDYHIPHMWQSFRLVCKMWKIETERVFLKKYVPRLTMRLFMLMSQEQGLWMEFSFASVSDDGTRVFFKCKEAYGQQDHWATLRQTYTPPPHNPFPNVYNEISIPDIACGDPVPEGLRLHPERKEISMLLAPMLNQLFGDEIALRGCAHDIVRSKQAAGHFLQDLRGSRILFCLVQQDHDFLSSVHNVRVARLRRVYKRHGVEFYGTEAHEGREVTHIKDLRIYLTRRCFRTRIGLMEFD
ncbi:hypothetical protein AAE478_006217 [Parahypoxylon ruwenzoriense]